ncbi:MAG: adenylate/guanylate cyclase domain-containing protein [Proteobacteria bacterium]|nr:adenylate/guanylate cyclase domain-containing protein [Pseudomonadota bacterium]
MIRFVFNRWVQIFLLLLLLAEAVMLRIENTPLIEHLQQLTFDVYNRILPRATGHGVAIIDIDEDSLRNYGQWPWPRPQVAQLPDILHQMGARAIAFDMVFAEPDRTSPALIAERLPPTPALRPIAEALKELPDNDQLFANKIAALGNVVTAFVAANQPGRQDPVLKAKFINEGYKPDPLRFINTFPYFAASLPALAEAAAGDGCFNMATSQDGIIRHVPLLVGQRTAAGQVNMYPTLALEALRVALGKTFYKVKSFGIPTREGYGIQSVALGDYTIPTDQRGRFQLYYAGHRPGLYIPAWKILTRQVSPSLIKDKIVLIGTSAIGLLDLRSSPLNPVLPGVEVHAEILEQILGGKFLTRPELFNGAELWAMGAVSLVVILLAPFVGTGLLALLILVLIGCSGVGALYAYQTYGLLLDPVYPSLAIIAIFILSSILTNLRTEMERRAVKTAFGHYISPALMEELANNPDKLKLGGEVRELSVMFTDIRNFTTISETMDPAELIRMMNAFLTPMTTCVLESRGTIDKYMGDAMMAFWNAPLDDPDHPRHACLAALKMLTALAAVNKDLQAAAEKHHKPSQHKPFRELKAGIGINTGTCSVGNMGSKQRFAYSALGDTVNLASRLEGQTKIYGLSTLISGSVQKRVPELATLEIDFLMVKGRSEPERIYTLLGDAGMAQSPAFLNLKDLHDKMLLTYREQRWAKAAELTDSCLNLWPELRGLYMMYQQRMAEFKTNPPPADWRGVWVAKEK